MIDPTVRKLEGVPPGQQPIEVVERKGLGHPDTICDAIAERICQRLCVHYLDRFGFTLHHNVDKVLLVGGAARVALADGPLTDLERQVLVSTGAAIGMTATHTAGVISLAEQSART